MGYQIIQSVGSLQLATLGVKRLPRPQRFRFIIDSGRGVVGAQVVRGWFRPVVLAEVTPRAINSPDDTRLLLFEARVFAGV